MNDPAGVPANFEADEPAGDASLAREQKLAAMKDFRERTNFQWSQPGSLTSLYLKERRALRRVFPGTLADLARDGIIQMRIVGDSESESAPDRSQTGS